MQKMNAHMFLPQFDIFLIVMGGIGQCNAMSTRGCRVKCTVSACGEALGKVLSPAWCWWWAGWFWTATLKLAHV